MSPDLLPTVLALLVALGASVFVAWVVEEVRAAHAEREWERLLAAGDWGREEPASCPLGGSCQMRAGRCGCESR